MTEDALIAEVRAARHEISEECGHDLRKLQERCQALQSELCASGRHEVSSPSETWAGRNNAVHIKAQR